MMLPVKKKSLGLLLAVVLSCGVVSPASAQNLAQPISEDSTTAAVTNPVDEENSEADEDPENSGEAEEPDLEVIIGSVVGVAALIGLIGGGVYWAVQQRMIPNPLPGIIPNPPRRVALAPAPKPAPAPAPAPAAAYFRNCSAARAAGQAPLYRGEPGYRSALDRDNDGVACE